MVNMLCFGEKHFNLTILLSTQNHTMSNNELLKQLDRILNVNWAIVKSYQRKRSCFRVQSTGLKHTSTISSKHVFLLLFSVP